MEGNRKEVSNESQKINFRATRNETSKPRKESSFAGGVSVPVSLEIKPRDN